MCFLILVSFCLLGKTVCIKRWFEDVFDDVESISRCSGSTKIPGVPTSY